MKITKLLAMLLALAMILCCFAACGGDKKEEGKEEEKTEAAKETEAPKETDAPAKDATLEGTWKMNIDLGAAMAGMSEEELEIEIPSLEYGIEWNFAEDGKFTATAVELPSDESFGEFYKVLMKTTFEAMMEMFSEDELAELLASEGYDSFDDYIDAMLEEGLEDAVAEMKETTEMFAGEYEVDGDVIKVIDEESETEAEITFEISGNEMTFTEVEDEYDSFTIFSGAKLVKK